MPGVIRRHVVVRGLVQGVGFRYSTAGEARRRGLTGSIANRPDGTVEAEIEGPDTAVERLVDWLRAGGPPGARVDTVEVGGLEPSGSSGFEIR